MTATKLSFGVSSQTQSNEFRSTKKPSDFRKTNESLKLELSRVQKKSEFKRNKREPTFIVKTDCDREKLFQWFYREKLHGTLKIREHSISSKVYCFYATA